MITNLDQEDLTHLGIKMQVRTEVTSITRTIGGRILATLWLEGIDYVTLHWGISKSEIVEPDPKTMVVDLHAPFGKRTKKA